MDCGREVDYYFAKRRGWVWTQSSWAASTTEIDQWPIKLSGHLFLCTWQGTFSQRQHPVSAHFHMAGDTLSQAEITQLPLWLPDYHIVPYLQNCGFSCKGLAHVQSPWNPTDVRPATPTHEASREVKVYLLIWTPSLYIAKKPNMKRNWFSAQSKRLVPIASNRSHHW